MSESGGRARELSVCKDNAIYSMVSVCDSRCVLWLAHLSGRAYGTMTEERRRYSVQYICAIRARCKPSTLIQLRPGPATDTLLISTAHAREGRVNQFRPHGRRRLDV